MSRILLGLMLISVTLLAGGCGPIYDTTYHFVPPASHEGKRCIRQCLRQKDRCTNQKQHCRQLKSAIAARRFNHYQNHHPGATAIDYQRILNHLDVDPEFMDCDNIYSGEACDAPFRECYNACGGQVIGKRACVFNCN